MRENTFRIVVPVYNSASWIGECIRSIALQSYTNWRAIIIDDASTDGTLEVIKQTLSTYPNKNQFRLFVRNMNVGALENTVFGTNSICSDDEDVVVVVDGDDHLYDSEVLNYLNSVYLDENIWLTYGSYVNASDRSVGAFNRLVTDTRTYRRSQDYTTSHLRTYKFKIWKRINDKDLRDVFGHYYKITGDLAVMFPLIEMAGANRIKYIEKPLYVYNDQSPINDHKKNAMLQIQVNAELRRKDVYEELRW